MQNAPRSSNTAVFIIIGVICLLLLVGGGIGLAVYLSQDSTVVECTTNSDCTSGNVCTNGLCVVPTSTRNTNNTGNTTGNVFVTSLADGCYLDVDDDKTYKIENGTTCFISDNATVGNICSSSVIRSNLNDITGGVAWDDPNTTLRACAVPQQSSQQPSTTTTTTQPSTTTTTTQPSTTTTTTQPSTTTTSQPVVQGTVTISEPPAPFRSSLPAGCYSGGGAQWYVNADGSPCHLDGTQFASACRSTSTASSLANITGGYSYNDSQAQRCVTSSLPTAAPRTTPLAAGPYIMTVLASDSDSSGRFKYLQAYDVNTVINSVQAANLEVQNWFIKPVAGKPDIYTITSMFGDNNRLVWRDPDQQNIIRAWVVNAPNGSSEWKITGSPSEGYVIVDPQDGYHLGIRQTNMLLGGALTVYQQAYAVNSAHRWTLTPSTMQFGNGKICAQNSHCTSDSCNNGICAVNTSDLGGWGGWF